VRVLVLAAALLASGAVPAAEKVHTVIAGESAASVAKTYYGDASLGDLLLQYNGKRVKMLHPGERLTVPFCEVYRARPGDTWSGLAKRHLGRSGAAPAVVALNGYAADKPLLVGSRVVIPVVLRHTLARGESLSSLAQRFYGDRNAAAMLQSFGRIDDVKRLAVGTPVEIPLVAFVRAEKPPAVAAPPPAPPPVLAKPEEQESVSAEAAVPAPVPPVEERRFEGPLDAAGRNFADGEYDRARETLEGLRERVGGEGSEWDRREWSRLLAFAYIALDRDDEACAAYRSGSPPAGPTTFDPDSISPRIRAVLSKCAEANPGAGRLDNPPAPPQIPPHADARG